jgi:hypothetical protein
MALAVLQLVLQGAFAVTDGLAAREGERAYSHIESHSSHCPRVHNDDCQICQVLANGTGPLPPVIAIPRPAVEVVAQVAGVVQHTPSCGRHPARFSRAPPLA